MRIRCGGPCRPAPDVRPGFAARPVRLETARDVLRQLGVTELEGRPVESLRDAHVDLEQVSVDGRGNAQGRLDFGGRLAGASGGTDEQGGACGPVAERRAIPPDRGDAAGAAAVRGQDRIGAAAPAPARPRCRGVADQQDRMDERRRHARCAGFDGRALCGRDLHQEPGPGGSAIARPATISHASSESATRRWWAIPRMSRNARPTGSIGTSPRPISSLTTTTGPSWPRIAFRTSSIGPSTTASTDGRSSPTRRLTHSVSPSTRIVVPALDRADRRRQVPRAVDRPPARGSVPPVEGDPLVELRIAGQRGGHVGDRTAGGESGRSIAAEPALAAAGAAEDDHEPVAHPPIVRATRVAARTAVK